jgi:hypothetical protein
MTKSPHDPRDDMTDDATIAAIRDDDEEPARGAIPERSGMPMGPWAHVSGRFSPAQRSLIIGGVLVLLSLVVFKLVSPTQVGYRSAKPGDCLEGSSAISAAAKPGQVRTVSGAPAAQIVSCDKPHVQEVMGQAELAGDRGAPYPVDGAPAQAIAACTALFETYVGRPLAGSSLGASAYFPERAEWEQQNERTVVCVVTDPSGATSTGSVKGSGR